MSYADDTRAELRRDVLVILHGADRFLLNTHVLGRELEAYGHAPSMEALRAELAWLEAAGLVTLCRDAAPLWVAELTEHGADTARGRARVKGVARPLPF